jgi:site-specific DNA-methyltransferase (adenine-specific)
MEMVSVEVLISNPLNNQVYVVNDDDKLLLESISKLGVLEPLIVNSENVILSGVRRFRVALQLGIKTLPVFRCDLHTDELTFGRLVSYNIQRNKTNEMVVKEYLALREGFKLSQGSRTDLDPQREVKENRLAQLYRTLSLASIKRCVQIYNTAFANNGGNVEDAWEWVRKTDKSSIDGVLKSIKRKYKGALPAPARKTSNKKGLETPVLVGSSPLRVVHRGDVETNTPNYRLYKGSNTLMTAVLDDNSVDCCFTSPPYFQLRDYQIGETQLGQEASVKKFIFNMMNTFNDVYRVLKPTGSLFVNIDDTVIDGNLCGVPEALVLEMKKNGWILNDRIIWLKTNPTPQKVKRTQPSTEFIYHFVKSTDFYYNTSWVKNYTFQDKRMTYGLGESIRLRNVFSFDGQVLITSNANTNYIGKKVADEGLKITHTATFPRELPLIGILSATKPGDVVLDCFNGLATTGEVALELGRNYIGFDLNDEYLKVSEVRLRKTVEEMGEANENDLDNLEIAA